MKLKMRERFLLGVLVAVLLFIGGRWVVRSASSGDLGLTLGRGSAGRVAEARRFRVEVAELRLQDLDRGSSKWVIGRDPFRFGAAPAPPAPPPPPAKKRPQPALPPPVGAQPPAFTFSYLGNFGKKAQRIAVFSDGETIHNAMVGEILDGKFIVAGIGFESVDIEFVGFPDAEAKRFAAGG